MALCILCDRALSPRDDGYYDHEPAEDCLVTLCDRFGVSVEPDEIAKAASVELPEEPTHVSSGFEINLDPFPRIDVVLGEIFHEAGVERLGGASTGRGWSSFNLFQKCPYAWKRRYIDQAQPMLSVELPGIAIGSLVHAFLATMYMCMVVEDYPVTPELIRERGLQRGNPTYINEAWRIFSAYRLFYTYDNFTPLAVEYNLRDPRTGESCRYDLVAFFPEGSAMREPGTYIIEHKTAQRFDMATLEGWANDGEVLGQITLWERLKLDKRFGKLKGVIVNICGKQKDPEFHRTIVSPVSWQVGQHTKDLKEWEGLIQLARGMDRFPRARHSCVSRFGMCEWFDHCATGD